MDEEALKIGEHTFTKAEEQLIDVRIIEIKR